MICNFQCFTKDLSDNPDVHDDAAFSFRNCNVEAFLELVVLFIYHDATFQLFLHISYEFWCSCATALLLPLIFSIYVCRISMLP
jgi:hypothetical protein